MLVAWIIFFSLAISFLILRTPALWFLSPPERFWLYLYEAFSVSCCESAADVSVVVSLIYGLVLSLVITFAVRAALSKRRNRLTRRSSGR